MLSCRVIPPITSLMGSSGTGSLTDYSNHKSGGGSGGASGQDRCREAFTATLEEVLRCDFYKSTGTVPPVGTDVNIIFNGVRLVATSLNGVEIGYLPTSRNYIRLCMQDGI